MQRYPERYLSYGACKNVFGHMEEQGGGQGGAGQRHAIICPLSKMCRYTML